VDPAKLSLFHRVGMGNSPSMNFCLPAEELER
jgi:hypothetical protein